MFFQIVNKYSVTLALLIPVLVSKNIVWFGLWWALIVLIIVFDAMELWGNG